MSGDGFNLPAYTNLVDHPVLGSIKIPGPPIRFDDNAFAGGREDHLHPPLLGEHNESVRAWLDELDRRG